MEAKIIIKRMPNRLEFNPSDFCTNHASSNGGEILIFQMAAHTVIKPKFIHLVAPFTVSPKNSVAIKSKIVVT